MSKSNEVLAIVCSDIHLSSRPPIARSAEPDWFKAMARQLRQLRELQAKYNVPVICAGDIFDKWNSTPELINFALDKLPDMYAVPGQHDLPEHNMKEIHRSAYWTLVRAGKIIHISGRQSFDKLVLYGFGWEQELRSIRKIDRDETRPIVAIVHRYCWHNAGTCYQGAPKDKQSGPTLKALRGYDAVVFGDNHISWYWNDQDSGVMNCGSFFRRRIDEVSHRPMVGLLYEEGIQPHYLDCSKDKFIDVAEGLDVLEKGLDLTGLVSDLKSLGNGTLDFVDTLYRYLKDKNVSESVRRIITQAMDQVK